MCLVVILIERVYIYSVHLSRVRRVLSGQNSRTFKYISRTQLQNSRTNESFDVQNTSLLICLLLRGYDNIILW